VVWSMVLLLTGCTPTAPSQPSARPTSTDDPVAAEKVTQPPDLVNLTVYLRSGSGNDAHLVPVIREVPVSDSLPRAALQLLIDGRRRDDPRGLVGPLPADTIVRRFAQRKATAVVDFSSSMRRAKSLRKRPEHAFLALTAIANTLTEFPDVDYVRPTVHGRSGPKLFGAWGMPSVLVRDSSVVEPDASVRIAEPDMFRRRAQRVGVKRPRSTKVNALRVRPTAMYLRLSAEITGTDGGDLLGPVPFSTARRQDKAIVLKINTRGRRGLAGNLRRSFDDPAFRKASVTLDRKRRQTKVRIVGRRPSAFWLHTLSQPARVVLDIRR
jgi:hypothetical protein